MLRKDVLRATWDGVACKYASVVEAQHLLWKNWRYMLGRRRRLLPSSGSDSSYTTTPNAGVGDAKEESFEKKREKQHSSMNLNRGVTSPDFKWMTTARMRQRLSRDFRSPGSTRTY